tara:strand:+ start:190 stop:615 length:426 start_codon:yes stop_codon:yes gene_type:complete
MDTNRIDGISRGNLVLNFNHLMQLYEINYTLFMNLLNNKHHFINNSSVSDHFIINYDLISSSKYTNIFRCYLNYKIPYAALGRYSIKPHIIFTLYKDVQLLEAKSLKQSRFFDTNISEKLKINMKAFYWLKQIHKKFQINQ